MSLDQESAYLLREISELWPDGNVEFRLILATLTGKHFTRQRVHNWHNRGVPKKWRAAVRQAIEQKTGGTPF